MGFGMEKLAKLIMKNRKPQMTERIELVNQEKSEHLDKNKLTSTWEY